MSDDDMKELIKGLTVQMGRLPTEDEVTAFIFGTREQREAILKGAKRGTVPPSEGCT